MFESINLENEFKNRLDKHYDELKWLYSELYHNDEQAFDYFLCMLHQYYEERDSDLREWDVARELVPDWYRGNEMLGMQMYVNCFNKTLKGVQEKIPYLQEVRFQSWRSVLYHQDHNRLLHIRQYTLQC
jgi:amylosucrase